MNFCKEAPDSIFDALTKRQGYAVSVSLGLITLPDRNGTEELLFFLKPPLGSKLDKSVNADSVLPQNCLIASDSVLPVHAAFFALLPDGVIIPPVALSE